MKLFNTVRIRTPESVELEFALAGIGSRAVALLIDYIILGIGLLLILFLWGFIAVQLSRMEMLLSVDTETLQLWALAILVLMLFASYVGYFVGFETWWYGQTPGKRFARIRVIRDDAQPARLFQATLRALVRPVDEILFLGFFCILLGQQEKRIGDWLAGTLVVQTDPHTEGKEVTLSERAKTIGIDLLNLINFELISPDDFATVREYLQRRGMLTAKAHNEVSLHLAQRLRDKTELEALPMEMTADTFLEAVYWAYQKHRQ
ncbi:MAG: RDD family protein [Cyanobacteria bacterium P01_F01_bin.86]